MRKSSKVLLVIGLCLMCLSMVISLFNFKNIFNPFFEMPNDYKRIEQKIETEDINSIYVDTDNEKVTVKATDNDYITISYYESSHEKYEFENKDGNVSLERKDTIRFFNFNLSFWHDREIIIEIPDELILSYKIYTDNARIEVSDLSISNSLFDTSNASIEMTNINSDNKVDLKTSNGQINIERSNINSIIAKTSNGSINIQDVKANNLSAKTSNGKILFDELEALNIDMNTSNARVEGNIIGNEEDYYKDIKTSNSHIEIDGREYGTKVLDKMDNKNELIIKTSNGRVNISFE